MESIAIPRGLLILIVSVAGGFVIAIPAFAVYQDRFPGVKKAVYWGVIISALAFMIVMFARERLGLAISVVLGLTLGQVIGVVRRARYCKGLPGANDQLNVGRQMRRP